MEIRNSEYEKMAVMKYDELCAYLLEKHGPVNGSYFINENCKSPNSKIKRSSEGLFIHHIKEDEFVQLNATQYAVLMPFEYQLGENLLYCDIIEHLLLHICIVKEFLVEKSKENVYVGIGGIMNHIAPQIIDYINGYEFKKEYLKTALKVVDGNEKFIVKVLQDFAKHVHDNQELCYAAHVFAHHNFDRLMWDDALFQGKMTSEGRFNDMVVDVSDVEWSDLKDIKERLLHLGQQNNTANYSFRKMHTAEGFNRRYEIRYYCDGKWVDENFCLKEPNAIEYINEYIEENFDLIDQYYINPNSEIKIVRDLKSKNKNKIYRLEINGNMCTDTYTKEQAEDVVRNIKYAENKQI